MINPVGYTIKHPDGSVGEPGIGYTYIMAGNGVFLESENPFIHAKIPVCMETIRGLGDETPIIELKKGKIPAVFFNLALDAALSCREKEVYFSLTWKNGYHLYKTQQTQSQGSVEYSVLENTVMDVHSHGKMRASFSSQDDRDEQGFRLSCVVGNLYERPQVEVRMCAYGAFWSVPWEYIFEGSLNGVTDKTLKEVEIAYDICCKSEIQQNNPGRSWWHRLFGL